MIGPTALLALFLPLVHTREVNWYLNEGDVASNTDLISTHPNSITGAYLCCGFGHFNATGSWVMPRYTNVSTYAPFIAPFTSTNRSVWIVMGVDTLSIQSGNWESGLEDAVRVAQELVPLGVKGWIVDYEPVKNYTVKHAQQYGAFLKALASRLAALSPPFLLGMDIASWSILGVNFWQYYTGLARFTSMTPTYDATNITFNEVYVREAQAFFPPSHYAAGIGSIWADPNNCPDNYLWNSTSLPPFIEFLGVEGVASIDIWRCDIDGQNNARISPVLLSALEKYLSPPPSLSPSAAATTTCLSPAIIPHSNTTTGSPCAGGVPLGTECPYECLPGFIPLGRHVCQSYTTASGVQVLAGVYWGGRCEPLCPTSPTCTHGTTPVRVNTTGGCLATQCLPQDEALMRLARGAYGIWRLARDGTTGIYSDSVNLGVQQQSDRGHIGVNGLGVMFECVAVEMGWITWEEGATRVNLTLSSLAGLTPGFRLSRQARDGWIPTFFSRTTGQKEGTNPPYTVLDTGLNSAGVLLAREYFLKTAPALGGQGQQQRGRVRYSSSSSSLAENTQLAQGIGALAKDIFNAVRFEHILCNASGQYDPSGNSSSSVVPFTFDDGSGCGGLQPILPDGFYPFSEVHYSVWLAYSKVCFGYTPGSCPAPQLEAMWEAWQGRRTAPNFAYAGLPLLSDWSSYIVHLPYYASHSFNSDPLWVALFQNHAAADARYYASRSFYQGSKGRWGLGAGPTDPWCSAKGGGYEADMLEGDAPATAGAQGCKLFSPYAVAGYMPANPEQVTGDLLALLAAGDTVVAVDSFVAGDYVVLRRSFIEPQWDQTQYISLVDFSSELAGLATYWLPEFWRNFTDHNFTELRGGQ